MRETSDRPNGSGPIRISKSEGRSVGTPKADGVAIEDRHLVELTHPSSQRRVPSRCRCGSLQYSKDAGSVDESSEGRKMLVSIRSVNLRKSLHDIVSTYPPRSCKFWTDGGLHPEDVNIRE